MQEEFKVKIDQLKNTKSELEFKLSDLKSDKINQVVTESDFRSLLNNFNGYVMIRNILECKKFIQSFVKYIYVDIKSIISRTEIFLVL